MASDRRQILRDLYFDLRNKKERRFALADHPLALRTTAVAVFCVAWELYGRSINPIFLSYPMAIIRAVYGVIVSGEIFTQFLETLGPLSTGFAAAVILGVALGIAMGWSRLVAFVLDPYMNALYSTPTVALIPVIMLWFGLGFYAKAVIVFLSAFFPVLVNTYTGVRNTSGTYTEIVKAYGANQWQIFEKVILPACVPFIMAGVRLAVGRAMVGIIVAEFFTAFSGLGYMIVRYANGLETDKLFVPVILLALLGVGLTEIVKRLEVRLSPWKETERAAQL